MSLTKKYSFHDTFIKSCDFKNGQGDCTKTRESKKCIDDHCEIVRTPMNKKEILNDYYQNYNEDYNEIKQQGGSPELFSDNTFRCPYCDLVLPVKDLPKHIKSHTNVESNQYGGCDTCMVGGNNNMIGGSRRVKGRVMTGCGVYKKKYICPLCHTQHYISHMKDHYLEFHQ